MSETLSPAMRRLYRRIKRAGHEGLLLREIPGRCDRTLLALNARGLIWKAYTIQGVAWHVPPESAPGER